MGLVNRAACLCVCTVYVSNKAELDLYAQRLFIIDGMVVDMWPVFKPSHVCMAVCECVPTCVCRCLFTHHKVNSHLVCGYVCVFVCMLVCLSKCVCEAVQLCVPCNSAI